MKISTNTKSTTRKKQKLFLGFAFLLLFCPDLFGQSFLQIRQKSLREEISTDFTYNVTGTAGYTATLHDKPDAVSFIYNIAGDGDGGLLAVAGTTSS